MSKDYYGLELQNTAIGNQGVVGTPQDNNWDLQTGTGPKGIFRNVGGLPTFYTQSLTQPWGVPLFFQNPSTGAGAVTFTQTTGTGNCLCPNPPCVIKGRAYIGKIAQKQPPYNALAVNDLSLTYTTTYATLKTDSSIYQPIPDSAVVTFKDSLSTTNIGAFSEVSDAILLNNIAQALQKNTQITVTGCMEESQKTVNDIYLHSWAVDTFQFTSTDSTTLYSIAYNTVEDCGYAVYDARVLLHLDINDYLIIKTKSMDFTESIPVGEDDYGIMYPNPANTVAYYETELKEGQSGFIQLFDVLGNSVSTKKLIAGVNKAQFDLTILSSGIYIYKVTIDNELKTSNKLVITK